MIDTIAEIHGIPKWEAWLYTELDYYKILARKNLDVARQDYKPNKPLQP